MLSSHGTRESSLHRQEAEREASDASPSSELLELDRLIYSVVPGVAELRDAACSKGWPLPHSIALEQGDYKEAKARFEESLAIFDKLGN
jgi:tetratricopeptide (TPR) repeat protein